LGNTGDKSALKEILLEILASIHHDIHCNMAFG